MKQRTQGDKPKKIPRPPQPDKKKKIEEKQKKEEVKEDKGGGGEEGDEEEGGDGDETPRKGTSGAISPSIDSKLRSAKNGDRGSKVSIASPVVDKYYREDERRDEGGRDNPQGEGDGDDEEDDEEVNVGDAGGMATMFAGGDGGVDKDEDEVRGAGEAKRSYRPERGEKCLLYGQPTTLMFVASFLAIPHHRFGVGEAGADGAQALARQARQQGWEREAQHAARRFTSEGGTCGGEGG